jgi:hypothetical protein
MGWAVTDPAMRRLEHGSDMTEGSPRSSSTGSLGGRTSETHVELFFVTYATAIR